MDQEDIVLVEAVEACPGLWDMREKEYKQKLKEPMWQSVAQTANMTVTESKRRWRSMRDYYNELKKKRAAPSGSAAAPLTSLQQGYLRYMSFLDPVLKPKPTSTSLDGAASPASPSDVSFDNIFEEALLAEASVSPARPATSPEPTAAPAPSTTSRPQAENARGGGRGRGAVRKRRAVLDDQLEQDILSALNEAKQSSPHDDFLRALAPLLNKMDEETCARFKVKVLSEATDMAYRTQQ